MSLFTTTDQERALISAFALATPPSGKHIDRTSDYCATCRYKPALRSGPSARPFNVFYWDFLLRSRQALAQNNRVVMIFKGADRISPQERTRITTDANALRVRLAPARP